MRAFILLGLILILVVCAPAAAAVTAVATDSSPSQTPAPTSFAPSVIPGATSEAQATAPAPAIRGVFGSAITFTTHEELASFGFNAGPSDGQFGAIPTGDANYVFYGFAAPSATCAGTKKGAGTYSFTGTLDHVTGSNGCARVFGRGDGPQGWIFDRDYAGGDQVVRFALNGQSGWLMPFHGEAWWQNPDTPDHRCNVSGGATVPCFYSALGLAVSTDEGKTFKVVGEIL